MVVTLLGFLRDVAPGPPVVTSPTDLIANVARGQIVGLQVVNSDGSLSPLPTSGGEFAVEDISINRQTMTGESELFDISLQPSTGAAENWWFFHGSTPGNIESTLLGGVFFFALGSSIAPIQVQNGPDSEDGVVVHLWSGGG